MDNQQYPKRKSIRLKEYDYSTPGYYFITICTKDKKCLFGEITDQGMKLNDAGRMVEKWFKEISKKYDRVICDEYVVMPNHFHGIIQIVGADLCVRPGFGNAHDLDLHLDLNNIGNKNKKQGRHTGLPLQDQNVNLSIHEILQWFKTMTTNQYIRGVKQSNWHSFNGKLWQRNYYEHVIRNDIDLDETREYITNNPKKWHLDKYNPITHGIQRTLNNV